MNNFRQEIQSLPLKLIYNILPQSLLHRGMLTHTVLTCKCLADDQVKFRAQQIMNTMRNWYWVFADCCSRSVPINTRVTIYFIRIYSLCPSMLLAILSIYSVVSSMPPMKYAVFNYMWKQTNNDPCHRGYGQNSYGSRITFPNENRIVRRRCQTFAFCFSQK